MISFRLFYNTTILLLFTQMAFSNTFSLIENEDNTWNVNYISDAIVAGFQFNVDGVVVINSASGGNAAENGFMISSSSSSTVVLGFSLTGSTIPPGEGILLWDKKHHNIKVNVDPETHKLITTNPEEMKRQKNER